jgi:hypothetical protein
MFLVNAEGGTIHVSLIPIAEPIVPAREFNADIKLPISEDAIEAVGERLEQMGHLCDIGWTFLYGAGWELVGIRVVDPKIAHIVLAYA